MRSYLCAFLFLVLPIIFFGGKEWRKEVLSSGSVLLCLHPLVLMPGELHGESAFSLRPNKFFWVVRMANRHIPTMTNSHHGGFLSVMIMVGICQWQNPTIDEDDEELQLFNHLTRFNSFDISEVIVTEVMCGPRAICLFQTIATWTCNPQKIILFFSNSNIKKISLRWSWMCWWRSWLTRRWPRWLSRSTESLPL